MKSIKTIFQRNIGQGADYRVRDEVVPGCEWVLNGEGVPTQKWDGTAILVRKGAFFKRYEWRPDKVQEPPLGFEPCEEPDPNVLLPHGGVRLEDCERTFLGIRDFLDENAHIEGIVWHHPDGRMAKIKAKDFGL